MPQLIDDTSDRLNTDRLPLCVALKPHQRALLLRALQVEQRAFADPDPANSLGFMTDRPGAGKTYVMLALVYVADKVILKGADGAGCTVIVAPHNIHNQWLTSMETIFGKESAISWRSLTYYGDVTSLLFGPEVLQTVDILLTTSLLYDALTAALRAAGHRVRRLIIDETDAISGVLRQRLPADMTWMVSGTILDKLIPRAPTRPDALVSLGEGSAYKTRMSIIESNQCRCDETYLDAILQLPDPDVVVHELPNIYVDELMAPVLTPSQLAAANGIDFSNNALGLRYIVQAAAENERSAARALYLDLHERVARERMSASLVQKSIKAGCEPEKLGPLTQEMSRLLAEADDAQAKAIIMTQRAEQNGVCTSCFAMHAIDQPCVSLTGPGDTVTKRNKARALRELLSEVLADPKRRAIVFSLHPGAALSAQTFLDKLGVQWADLDGGGVTRIDTAVRAFTIGDARVIFIASTQLGVGLDLQVASDVIFCHAVPRSLERQVVGRAQRIGRRGRLMVHMLLHQNEEAKGIYGAFHVS